MLTAILRLPLPLPPSFPPPSIPHLPLLFHPCFAHSYRHSSFLLPLKSAMKSGKHCKLPTVASEKWQPVAKVRGFQNVYPRGECGKAISHIFKSEGVDGLVISTNLFNCLHGWPKKGEVCFAVSDVGSGVDLPPTVGVRRPRRVPNTLNGRLWSP